MHVLLLFLYISVTFGNEIRRLPDDDKRKITGYMNLFRSEVAQGTKRDLELSFSDPKNSRYNDTYQGPPFAPLDYAKAAGMCKMTYDPEMEKLALDMAESYDPKLNFTLALLDDVSTLNYTVIFPEPWPAEVPRVTDSQLMDFAWQDWNQWHQLAGIVDNHYHPGDSDKMNERINRDRNYVMLDEGLRKIGCVFLQVKQQVYFICMMGPRNLIPGKQVYAEGPACSKCPADTKCDQDWKLCTA
ncbi:unnamed protein product, partial [Mesorhabditis spiculigera]